MTLQLRRYKITVEEYFKMAEVGILKPTDRVELIKGEILTMSPINNSHLGLVNILTRLFFQKVGDNATISIQNPIRLLDTESAPEPDFVLAKFRKDGYKKKGIYPKDTYLIIEVADSTLKYDQKVKMPIYASANIPEYWIINLKKQQVEQYKNPKNDKYAEKKIYKVEDVIDCGTINFSLKVADLFV